MSDICFWSITLQQRVTEDLNQRIFESLASPIGKFMVFVRLEKHHIAFISIFIHTPFCNCRKLFSLCLYLLLQPTKKF